jgi:hypothetical protein
VLFASPDDVKNLQTQVEQQTKALTDALRDCIKAGKVSPSSGATGDPTIWRDWKTMAKRVAAYLNAEPDWLNASNLYDQGIAILHDEQPWYARVNAAGCQAPQQPSPPPQTPKWEGWAGDWGTMVALALLVFGLHEAKGL